MTTSILVAVTYALVALTGHDDFETRSKATEILAAMRPLSYSALIAGSQSSDPEVKYRCNRLIKEVKPKVVKDWLDKRVYPYIDSVPSENYVDRCTCWHQFLTLANQHSTEKDGFKSRKYPLDWPEYRRATRIWLEGRLTADMTFAEAEIILDAMWVKEFRQYAWPQISKSPKPFDELLEVLVRLWSSK